MATAKFYKGQPVKRMYRTDGGIKLIMVGPVPGVAGKKLVISQEEWDTHGERRDVEKNTTSALRDMVKSRSGKSAKAS